MEQNQFVKGSLATIILKLLEDNGRMYGYEMTKAVKDITANRMNITEAALYPALHKMVADGVLSATTELVDGRVRKYYSLTKKGKKETANKISALRDALESVQLILTPKIANG
ncbi:PadR family transcriptional regulator [Chitinophagaceae bacterium IBVUCB1]|nr:PadR family transcriptional regulator [Chitinophagaceae bacterium IBVUCB1]